MTYLVDANVWFEAVLGGVHESEAAQFIRTAPLGVLATTDFAVHSFAVYVYRNHPEKVRAFLDDLIRRQVSTLHLPTSSLYAILDIISNYGLDFDDAFQYFAAEWNNLKIVSFDTYFDRAPRGRLTPAQAMQEMAAGGAPS